MRVMIFWLHVVLTLVLVILSRIDVISIFPLLMLWSICVYTWYLRLSDAYWEQKNEKSRNR
jgi:hypothetical protein